MTAVSCGGGGTFHVSDLESCINVRLCVCVLNFHHCVSNDGSVQHSAACGPAPPLHCNTFLLYNTIEAELHFSPAIVHW